MNIGIILLNMIIINCVSSAATNTAVEPLTHCRSTVMAANLQSLTTRVTESFNNDWMVTNQPCQMKLI